MTLYARIALLIFNIDQILVLMVALHSLNQELENESGLSTIG